MKILVVGLGYVGSPLATKLAESGHDVLGVRRSAGPEPAGVPVLRGDALSGELWRRLPADFDQVVVLLSAGERSEAAYERTYLGGARSVRSAFPEARIVWVSSTAVYDADDDARIDDSTPASATGGTAQILLRAEAALHPGPCLIVRPSGIYGPERTSLLRRLLRGDVGLGEQATWTNRIHRDDLVRALAFCVERPALSGTLLASDQEPARLGDMQAWVRAELARLHASATPREGVGVPPGATAAAAPGAASPPAPASLPPDALSPSGDVPPASVGTRTARADARKSRRIIASRLTALGFSWHYPSYREGYLDLLRDA